MDARFYGRSAVAEMISRASVELLRRALKAHDRIPKLESARTLPTIRFPRDPTGGSGHRVHGTKIGAVQARSWTPAHSRTVAVTAATRVRSGAVGIPDLRSTRAHTPHEPGGAPSMAQKRSTVQAREARGTGAMDHSPLDPRRLPPDSGGTRARAGVLMWLRRWKRVAGCQLNRNIQPWAPFSL